MKIVLYKTDSPTNQLDKVLVECGEVEGAMRKNVSVVYPYFLMKQPSFEFNYLYIPDFGRYYFVKSISKVRTGLITVNCNVDVLMSYKEEILESKIVLEMYSGADDMVKPSVDKSVKPVVSQLKYNDIFTEPSLICVFAGGK